MINFLHNFKATKIFYSQFLTWEFFCLFVCFLVFLFNSPLGRSKINLEAYPRRRSTVDILLYKEKEHRYGQGLSLTRIHVWSFCFNIQNYRDSFQNFPSAFFAAVGSVVRSAFWLRGDRFDRYFADKQGSVLGSFLVGSVCQQEATAEPVPCPSYTCEFTPLLVPVPVIAWVTDGIVTQYRGKLAWFCLSLALVFLYARVERRVGADSPGEHR